MLLRKLLIPVLLTASAAPTFGGAPAPALKMEFVGDGAVLRFARPTRVSRIELWMTDGEKPPRCVLAERLHDRPITRHRLFLDLWNRRYTVKAFVPGEEPLEARGVPVIGGVPDVSMVLQVPYTGEADVTERWGRPRTKGRAFFSPGAAFSAEVEVLAWTRAVKGELRLVLDKGLEPAGPLPDWKTSRDDAGRTILAREADVATPMQIRQFLIPLNVTGKEGDRSAVSARLTAKVSGWTYTLERSVPIRVVAVSEVRKGVAAAEVLMPTDAHGERDVRKPRDTVLLPSGMGLALRRYLGFSEQYFDYYAPFTHHTVLFENRGTEPVPLAVTMQVLNADDDLSPGGFRPPDYLAGADGRFTVTAELAPGAETPVVLPLFVRPEDALPGRYRSVVEARILGTDIVAAHLEHPFQVRVTDLRALVVTGAAIVSSLAGLLLFLGRQRKVFGTFRVSELVLIALFATMTFVLVIFPGSVLGPLFSAVAGPFGFLIQGIFFEILRILVLVTLLVLVPRVGTVTLVSVVRYLIGGLAFGGFTPVDLFYLGASVVLMEVVLYAAGVTSKRGVLRRRDIGLASFVYVALLLGVVNGATQYVIYCLNITFYRLYFADWFIWLSVVVNGFLYAVLGALPGMKLGLRLRRISE